MYQQQRQRRSATVAAIRTTSRYFLRSVLFIFYSVRNFVSPEFPISNADSHPHSLPPHQSAYILHNNSWKISEAIHFFSDFFFCPRQHPSPHKWTETCVIKLMRACEWQKPVWFSIMMSTFIAYVSEFIVNGIFMIFSFYWDSFGFRCSPFVDIVLQIDFIFRRRCQEFSMIDSTRAPLEYERNNNEQLIEIFQGAPAKTDSVESFSCLQCSRHWNVEFGSVCFVSETRIVPPHAFIV